jgi:hypothetical protein
MKEITAQRFAARKAWAAAFDALCEQYPEDGTAACKVARSLARRVPFTTATVTLIETHIPLEYFLAVRDLIFK